MVAIGFLIAFVWMFSLYMAYDVGFERGEDKEYRLFDKKPPAVEPAPKPICLCSHGVNFHENNKCRQTVSVGGPGGWYNVKCSCRKYIGPEPLPEFYHPLEIGK